MPTISIATIDVFDATKGFETSFEVADVQSVANSIEIYDSVSGQSVYSDTTPYPTYTLSHVIPANALSNGGSYYYTITAFYHTGYYTYTASSTLSAGAYSFSVGNVNYTFEATKSLTAGTVLTFNPASAVLTDNAGNVIPSTIGSAGTSINFIRETAGITSSASQIFWCYSDPVVYFNNIHNDSIITTSTFTAELVYKQSELERLNEYIVYVNKADGSLAFNSGSRFAFMKNEYQFIVPNAGLSAGQYHFVVNGANWMFTTQTLIPKDAILSFDASANILVLLVEDSASAITVTPGTTGTFLNFNIVCQTAHIEISGLSDDNKYSISIIGRTAHNINVALFDVRFTASYDTQALYGILTVDNLPLDGVVRVTSNMAAVDGVATVEPEYQNSERVVLTDPNATVTFANGFNVSDKFFMRGSISDIVYGSTAVQFASNIYRYAISFHVGNFGNGDVCYGMLKQEGVGVPSFALMSNCISPLAAGELLTFVLRYDGSYYTFEIGGAV